MIDPSWSTAQQHARAVSLHEPPSSPKRDCCHFISGLKSAANTENAEEGDGEIPRRFPSRTWAGTLFLSLRPAAALAARQSAQGCEELRSAESLLSLVINFPTACAALGNGETRLCSGISQSLLRAHALSPALQALDSRISWSALGFPGSVAKEGGISLWYPKEQEPESSTERHNIKSHML